MTRVHARPRMRTKKMLIVLSDAYRRQYELAEMRDEPEVALSRSTSAPGSRRRSATWPRWSAMRSATAARRSGTRRGRTAAELPALSAEEVSGMVEVAAEGEAEIVSVTATSPEPAQARQVANEFARQFI